MDNPAQELNSKEIDSVSGNALPLALIAFGVAFKKASISGGVAAASFGVGGAAAIAALTND